MFSHSPYEALVCEGPCLSFTQPTHDANTSASVLWWAKYNVSPWTSGAMPVDACVSSSHSTVAPSPLVSGVAVEP